MWFSERVKMIKAMEFLVRHINYEPIYDPWLLLGVPDGTVEFGDLSVSSGDEFTFDTLLRDDDFTDLMDTFLFCMSKAYKCGGLVCDDVCSKLYSGGKS